MERNRILQLALISCRVLKYYFIFEIILATSLLVYWHFDKNYFSTFHYNVSNKNITQSIETNSQTEQNVDKHIYPVSDLIPVSLYFVYFQYAGSSLLQLMMILQVINIINSLRDFKTFQNKNVGSLRKIGILYSIYFILNIFSTGFTEKEGTVSFSFSGFSLVILISVFILAEIFKEGTKLYEESQLTV